MDNLLNYEFSSNSFSYEFLHSEQFNHAEPMINVQSSRFQPTVQLYSMPVQEIDLLSWGFTNLVAIVVSDDIRGVECPPVMQESTCDRRLVLLHVRRSTFHNNAAGILQYARKISSSIVLDIAFSKSLIPLRRNFSHICLTNVKANNQIAHLCQIHFTR